MQRRGQLQILSAVLSLAILAVFAMPADAGKYRWWKSGGNHWVKKYDNGKWRYRVLRRHNREAVLDRETKLVWERVPEPGLSDWASARFACADKMVGGRKGYRLPSYNELAGLIHEKEAGEEGVALAPGHPFELPAGKYWTSTFDYAAMFQPTLVDLETGKVSNSNGTGDAHVWCVRGSAQGSNLQ